MTTDDLVTRLRTRADIRRNIPTRKSVQEGKPDRISDLLDEAADEIERLRGTGMLDIVTRLRNRAKVIQGFLVAKEDTPELLAACLDDAADEILSLRDQLYAMGADRTAPHQRREGSVSLF